MTRVRDSTVCANCYAEFADHDYVKNSIDQYRCPHPKQETGYGFFHGGDPRNFHPDHESCTPEEIANHEQACELANTHGDFSQLENPSETVRDPKTGKLILHILKAPFGIGTYVYEYETFFKAIETEETQ